MNWGWSDAFSFVKKHSPKFIKAAKLAWKHKDQIKGLYNRLFAQKDVILAENPDMDQSLFELDPENASMEELQDWFENV